MNRRVMFTLAVPLILAAAALTFHSWGKPVPIRHQLIRPLGCRPLPDGRYLITDGGGADWSDTGSKILIVNRRGAVEWVYDQGLRFAHSAIMLKNGHILIPDTNNDRLLEISMNKRLIWSSEAWGDGTGNLPDGSRLNYPNYVQELANGHFLLSDRLNSRVIEIDRTGKIYWQFTGASKQHAPKYIGDDKYLIADSDHNRIIEIDRSGKIIWAYATGLSWPRDAARLADGNTLITDSRNNRILLISSAGKVLREIRGFLSAPYQGEPLPNGNYLVCDAQHGRVLELTPQGKTVWEFRNRRRPSYPAQMVNGGAEDHDASGKPSGWTICDLTAHNAGRWYLDDRVRRSGDRSLGISAEPQGEPANKWWGQMLKVKPGDKLKLTAYARTEDVRGGAVMSLGYLDKLGGAIGGVNSAVLNGTNDWRELSIILQVPKGVSHVSLSLSLMGTGRVWFDDVILAKN